MSLRYRWPAIALVVGLVPLVLSITGGVATTATSLVLSILVALPEPTLWVHPFVPLTSLGRPLDGPEFLESAGDRRGVDQHGCGSGTPDEGVESFKADGR